MAPRVLSRRALRCAQGNGASSQHWIPVVELSSFTRAGERLNLTRPGVSRLIKLLGRRCRFLLFDRSKNWVIPTAEGEMLSEEVDRVFHGLR
ncbi:helix-turn-helix domain-containing protein [Pelagivirga sediminicola]|nr:LysR family transcriptional regulator [Pelagivirga sediminicola]